MVRPAIYITVSSGAHCSMATDGPLTPQPAAPHQETDPRADGENGDTGQPVEVQPLYHGWRVLVGGVVNLGEV